jgi:hypothetical protein
VRRPPEAADLRALDERYSRNDDALGRADESFAAAVMIIISIERDRLDRLGLTRKPRAAPTRERLLLWLRSLRQCRRPTSLATATRAPG